MLRSLAAVLLVLVTFALALLAGPPGALQLAALVVAALAVHPAFAPPLPRPAPRPAILDFDELTLWHLLLNPPREGCR